MTPTDALIEKMARAIAIADGWPKALVDKFLASGGHAAGKYLAFARAAYEAEHGETKG